MWPGARGVSAGARGRSRAVGEGADRAQAVGVVGMAFAEALGCQKLGAADVVGQQVAVTVEIGDDLAGALGSVDEEACELGVTTRRGDGGGHPHALVVVGVGDDGAVRVTSANRFSSKRRYVLSASDGADPSSCVK